MHAKIIIFRVIAVKNLKLNPPSPKASAGESE
jgi:hypothetical protein